MGSRSRRRVLAMGAILAWSSLTPWVFAQTSQAQPAQFVDAFRTPAKEVNSITMRPSARVSPGASVLLGDIAILDGSLAKSLSGVVVVGAADVAIASPLEIPIARVRSALAGYDSTVEGRVLVNGSLTRVWVGEVAKASPRESAPAAPMASTIAGPTVRDAVLEKIAGVLGVEASQVVLRFEAQDAAFLNTSTRGRTVAASPTGTGERVGVMVKVYERDRVVASQSLRVGVAIRRLCAVVSSTLDRGQSLSEGSFRIEEREVAPGVAIADPATLVGRSTKSRLAPGRIIEARDVETPVVVSRGDIVTIECLSGGILLKTYGRARGSGREGDIVSFEPLRRGRTFEARIAGPGRAVALIDGEEASSSIGTPLASEAQPERVPDAPEASGANGFFLALP
jgi:flagella basal body P-ring formation protein FlgA